MNQKSLHFAANKSIHVFRLLRKRTSGHGPQVSEEALERGSVMKNRSRDFVSGQDWAGKSSRVLILF